MQFVFSCAQYAIENGYYMVMWFVNADEPEELQKLIRRRMVDGIILMEARNNDPFVRILNEEQIPFFIIGRDKTHSGRNFISIDFHASMKVMLQWLLANKHKNICFINHSFATLKAGYLPTISCHEAFQKLCSKMGISGTEIFCTADQISGYNEVKKILRSNPHVSAIVSLNQSCLAGIIKAVTDSGEIIPDTVSVIAFVVSSPVGINLLPMLTSFEIDIAQIMKHAVSQLISLINNPGHEISEQPVLCTLVERQSTAPFKNVRNTHG
jgi:LacI family transcriptional regulator